MPEFGRIVEYIVEDYYQGRFDLTARGNVPSPASWAKMPPVECVEFLRESDVPDRTILLYLTFIAAIDRGRDSSRCWWNSLELYERHPEVFDPLELFKFSVEQLDDKLKESKVSQGNEQGPQAWLDIAQTIALESHCAVSRVIYGKTVDAKQLLKDLATRGKDNRNRFPLLSGTKTSQKWIHLLARLGGAKITHLDALQITVDSDVIQTTKNLGMLKQTRDDTAPDANYIQSVWRSAVDLMRTDNANGTRKTCTDLDPALSFFSKHGCGYCDKSGTPTRLGRACNYCRLLV